MVDELVWNPHLAGWPFFICSEGVRLYRLRQVSAISSRMYSVLLSITGKALP
ncbi:MAG: hypothetical protein LBF62_08375 [Tannerellaceae bacterium]|nr:hypothetical protein [Tannerellaceae bacterium]